MTAFLIIIICFKDQFSRLSPDGGILKPIYLFPSLRVLQWFSSESSSICKIINCFQ